MSLTNCLGWLKAFPLAILIVFVANVRGEETFQNYQALEDQAKKELEDSLNSRIDVVKQLSISVLSDSPKKVEAIMRNAIFEGYNSAIDVGFINAVKWQVPSDGDLPAFGVHVESYLFGCVAVSGEYDVLRDYMALTGSSIDDMFGILLRIEDLATIPDQWVQQAEISVVMSNAHAVVPRKVDDPRRTIWIDYDTKHRDAFLVKMASIGRFEPSRLAELLIAPHSRLDEVFRQGQFAEFYQIIDNLLSVRDISPQVVRRLSESIVLKYDDKQLVMLAQIFLSESERASGAVYDVAQVASFAEGLGKPLFAEALRNGMKNGEAGEP